MGAHEGDEGEEGHEGHESYEGHEGHEGYEGHEGEGNEDEKGREVHVEERSRRRLGQRVRAEAGASRQGPRVPRSRRYQRGEELWDIHGSWRLQDQDADEGSDKGWSTHDVRKGDASQGEARQDCREGVPSSCTQKGHLSGL